MNNYIGGYALVSLKGIDVADGGTLAGIGKRIHEILQHKFIVLCDLIVDDEKKLNIPVQAESSLTYTEEPDDWDEEQDGVFVPEAVYSATIKNVYGYDLSIVNDTITSVAVAIIVTADDIDSGEATEGQVLLADGEGGADWGSVPIDASQLFGKFVRIINASDIDPDALTDEQIDLFKEGVFINGTIGSAYNAIMGPARPYDASLITGYCLYVHNSGLQPTGTYSVYNINLTTKKLSIVSDAGFGQNGSGVSNLDSVFKTMHFRVEANDITFNDRQYTKIAHLNLSNKTFPAYPTTNADPAVLAIAASGGSLSWAPFVNNVAPEFSDATTYAENDLVIYQGVLYKCSNAAGHTGAWDAADFTRTYLSEVI